MIRPQKVEDITEANWDEMIDVNLKSAFLVTQAFLPGMRKQRWGTDREYFFVAAQVGGLVGPHYAASKAGMLGLAHAYASVLVKEGITVNSVCPALNDTEMVRSNPRANPGLIPVGRFGAVEEVASVVLMMVGNAYMTGQTVNVIGWVVYELTIRTQVIHLVHAPPPPPLFQRVFLYKHHCGIELKIPVLLFGKTVAFIFPSNHQTGVPFWRTT